jgi:hypothetical protein
MMQAQQGVLALYQILVHNGQLLDDGTALASYGVAAGSTVHQTTRLRGGKPVKVKIVTNHLPCGQEVTIDLDSKATKTEIKRKLESATGVPAAHQKVMLSGINQIVMGDTRWAGQSVVRAADCPARRPGRVLLVLPANFCRLCT